MMGAWDAAASAANITTRTPHPTIFYRPDALPDAQPTVSKHRTDAYRGWNSKNKE